MTFLYREECETRAVLCIVLGWATMCNIGAFEVLWCISHLSHTYIMCTNRGLDDCCINLGTCHLQCTSLGLCPPDFVAPMHMNWCPCSSSHRPLKTCHCQWLTVLEILNGDCIDDHAVHSSKVPKSIVIDITITWVSWGPAFSSHSCNLCGQDWEIAERKVQCYQDIDKYDNFLTPEL